MDYVIGVVLKNWEFSGRNKIELNYCAYLKYRKLPLIKFNLLEPVLTGAWDCICVPTGYGKLNSKIEKILLLIYSNKIPIDDCFPKIGNEQIKTLNFDHNIIVLGDGTIEVSIPLDKLPKNIYKKFVSGKVPNEIAAHLRDFLEDWFNQGISCIKSLSKLIPSEVNP